MTKATIEPNGHGRYFININNRPTFLAFDHPITTVKYIRKGWVEVDGELYSYNQSSIKGVMDNRHRNWKRRG